MRIGDLTKQRRIAIVEFDFPQTIENPVGRVSIDYFWSPEGNWRSNSPVNRIVLERGQSKLLWYETRDGVRVGMNAMVMDPPLPSNPGRKFSVNRISGAVNSDNLEDIHIWPCPTVVLEANAETTAQEMAALAYKCRVVADKRGTPTLK